MSVNSWWVIDVVLALRPKQVNRIVMQLSLDIRWTSRGEKERDGDGGDWCLAVLEVTIGFDEGRAGVV